MSERRLPLDRVVRGFDQEYAQISSVFELTAHVYRIADDFPDAQKE